MALTRNTQRAATTGDPTSAEDLVTTNVLPQTTMTATSASKATLRLVPLPLPAAYVPQLGELRWAYDPARRPCDDALDALHRKGKRFGEIDPPVLVVLRPAELRVDL